VEQYSRSVGQIFAVLGAQDPRLDRMGKIDFRLCHQLSAYKKEDPAPTRMRPVLLQLFLNVHQRALSLEPCHLHLVKLTLVAFFFLLWPGEYCIGGANMHHKPFRLCDVHFFVGPRKLPATTAAPANIATASFVALTFTDQKNGIKGKLLGHGLTDHPYADPVCLLASIVGRSCSANAPPTQLLASVFCNGAWLAIKSTAITAALRTSATAIGDTLGFRAARHPPAPCAAAARWPFYSATSIPTA